jgi:hypothetical protein
VKRATTLFLLIVFLISELFLLTTVLPERFQMALLSKLSWGSDNSMVTHPALNFEIDEVLRQHPSIRIGFIFCMTLLLVANSYLLIVLWRKCRRGT